MKTVLTISDSIEGTTFDLLSCTATIRDFGLDPLAVVPRIVYKDNSAEQNDVSEMLDYAFGECEFAAMGVGFIAEPEVIRYVADKLEQNKTAPVICCPSLISEEGEILVSSEVYEALCDRLLHFTDFLLINTIEAETFCGFECPLKNDFLRAAKKIYNVYGCRVFIKGNERTDGQNVLYEGSKPVWIDPAACEPGYEDKYSLLTALACEFAIGNPPYLSATLAIEFVSGKKREESSVEKSVTETPEKPEVKPSQELADPQPIKEEETAKEEITRSKVDLSVKVSRTPVPSLLTSSLVTPGKSIRDMAREMTPSVKTEETKSAVTSVIEKTSEPKGEVTSIASSRLLFDSKVNDSITELQSLKDRLNNLNRLANSGK